MTDLPFVVVGGGILGTALARQLQRRTGNVILVERDVDPQGATAFSFASLSAFDEPVTELYALKSMGMSEWRRWAREIPGELGLRWEGEVRWAEDPAGAQRLEEMIQRASQRGYAVERLSEGQLRDRLPGSRPSKVLAACHAPHDGQVDTGPALQRVREDFLATRGKMLVGRASLRFDEDGVYVRAGSQEVAAGKVVVATGAETHDFLDRLGWEVPVEARPGLVVSTEPTDPVVTGTVYVDPVSGPPVHLRQAGDGTVLIGEESQDFEATDPTTEHGRLLFNQAARAFPALERTSMDQVRVESRPIPRDRLPIVGPLPGVDSVYVAAAHAGVTLAPVLARMAAQELIDGSTALQLEPCRPGRFERQERELAQQVDSAFRLPSEVFLG